MNWELAIEKNHGALKRIVAMLVAMVGMTGGEDSGTPQATLPRHLHRFILRLLRPAEAATRRLIIVAARGLVVKLPKPHAEKSAQRARRPDPRVMPEWARLRLEHGLPIEFPCGTPIPLWARDTASRETPVHRPRGPFFPMFDPMKRFDRKPPRKRIPDAQMPRITLLNDDEWSVPVHLRRPAPPPPPPPPTPDDPLDAGNIHRRLEMIGQALDDLPRQALRMARWQARRDARLAAERENNRAAPFSVAPPSVLSLVEGPDISPTRGEISSGAGGSTRSAFAIGEARGASVISPHVGEMSGPSTRLRTEGGAKERQGQEATLIDLGLTPEAIALLNRSKLSGRNAQPTITAQTAKPHRFHRISPMRPGRPPGWRRKPNHDVYEVLNELHGLAVWASERRDSS